MLNLTPNLFELLLIGLLATYRITALFVDEAGPFDVFGRFRTWAGISYDEYSHKVASNQFAEGLMCFLCTSVWIGFGVFATIFASVAIAPLAWLWMALLPFALSGGAVFMKKWTG